MKEDRVLLQLFSCHAIDLHSLIPALVSAVLDDLGFSCSINASIPISSKLVINIVLVD